MRKAAFATFVVLLVAVLGAPLQAATLATCAPDISWCEIPENTLLQLPFFAISGDVILLESDLTTVSDVFRIFNDVVDTGAGTGLGETAFLFSADDGPLPDPSTYSANAVAILESPSGITDFNGNGTIYELGAPEPSTFALLGLGSLVAAWRRRHRSR